MKFCKALHKVAEASDPSYRPYWTNYKKLKKLIKAIVVCDVNDDDMAAVIGVDAKDQKVHAASKSSFVFQQQRQSVKYFHDQVKQSSQNAQHNKKDEAKCQVPETKTRLQKNPQEVAFFKLLRAELGKASSFFEKAEKQFALREEIVRVGMEVLKRPRAATVKDRWTVLSRAVFMLYKDLLVLETFAIMTYFAFSKILKKHDKVTGHETREPFMVNVVNKANFTNYPKIMEMIGRCQLLYNDASQRLVHSMNNDEQLLLQMVQQIQQTQQQHSAATGRAMVSMAAASTPHGEGLSANDEDLDRKPAALSHADLMSRRRARASPTVRQNQWREEDGTPDNRDARRPIKKRRTRLDDEETR